jgi:polyribonucleotide nucleotidyltransferase
VSQDGSDRLPSPLPVATQLELEVPGAVGSSSKITIETGEIGRQAAGAVTLTSGETVLYCTACAEADPDIIGEENGNDGGQVGMVPLTVVYSERFSAAGKTSGGYLKRDGRPRDGEVLTSRLVDRPIRPMFSKGWQRDTQVISWLLSYDGQHKPEPLAITAAGCALAISDIPLNAPVAGVRVARITTKTSSSEEGGEVTEFVVNPTVAQMKAASLDLLVAGTEDGVLMIEGSADLVSSEEVLQAVDIGHTAIKHMCKEISKWAESVGKPKREVQQKPNTEEKIIESLLSEWREEFVKALSIYGKQERASKLGELKEKLSSHYLEGDSPLISSTKHYNIIFKQLMSLVVREMIVEDGKRIDGRGLNDIRPITSRAQVNTNTPPLYFSLLPILIVFPLYLFVLGSSSHARQRSLHEGRDAGHRCVHFGR